MFVYAVRISKIQDKTKPMFTTHTVPPQLSRTRKNKAGGPVSCSTGMAIVNHTKGTSIHLRHSSLSQTRQKSNSSICQLLWRTWEITTTRVNVSACVKITKTTQCKVVRNTNIACVPVFDDLRTIVDVRLSDTCKQGRRHTRCVVQTAVYHTANPETRTGSAFTASRHLTRSRPLSLPVTHQHQRLFRSSF